MKSTGIVRRIDELGRIVIPMELRRTLDISRCDPVEVYTEDDKIILKKFQESCIFCGNSENITNFKDKAVCADCLKQLMEGN